ncbi:serine protease Do 5 (plasmid) [Rhizobium gallicum bv. gallicum R602sp]|uniref:Serine protease Do 5 n=1 Tax=Rhizobium gallicum bv. gallicum R602sp TaxID=1041138 RepID=A0A0B4XHX2_9HYPH|nr:Do family serine endopeptidase [Rhizobium gallicum]AJD46017.1 serine protease Do 5 [Rhizobium gallicum bv. gallicum R602sp]TDW32315.1 serine protease Do [Rhizobium azibense]
MTTHSTFAAPAIGAFISFFMVLVPLPALPAEPQTEALAAKAGSLADVLDGVTPAVVNIAVRSGSPGEANPLYNDPFFRRYFNLPDPQPRMSAGSGVIVDAANGYILTNHHVVADADQIMVTLKDRRRLSAELIGSDKATDIALLKISGDNLTALPFGESDKLRVGDTVVAIGNPFGLGQTVTSGIVSALGRSGINIEGYEDFIQTDASINPGNSGGALVSAEGRLVGINTAIIAPAGGNVGIGFAVPIAMASAVMKQLIEHGEVRRGRIGVAIQDLTPDLAQALGIADTKGAVVSSVEERSPAAAAGLQAGDVITNVGDHAIAGSTDLRNRIGLAEVGSEIALTYMRDGARNTARLRIEADRGAAEAQMPDRLGGARFDEGSGSVSVTSVEEGSPAARAGLRRGDVIVAINRKPVSTITDLNAAFEGATETIALELVRDGQKLFLVIR